ncbi:MAG TPA: PfkB family carbohydrate kinase [Bryobacteraceae bacterium]|nr:PfkB family carbohydrate kinase [Bryobacteraceae bacterium]
MVVVGSVAYDGVETPHGKRDRMLGGACTYIALSASFFTQPKIVAVVGDDFAQEDTDLLASRGIDLTGLERVSGKSFFWAGRYSPDMNDRETLATELNVFADFDPKLPDSYKSTPYLLLGNIQPALQRVVRSQMNGSLRLVGGDTMNYWIADFREELLKTIAEWDFLLINDGEARMLSGEYNLKKAAAKILDMGPNTLVIKRGEYGAILWRRDGHFMVPGYLLEDVFDPTGAGDCFAGGFMGYLAGQGIDLKNGADHNEIRRAVIYGSVMGSFCCERFGVDRFRTLTRSEIDGRFEEFKQFTSF